MRIEHLQIGDYVYIKDKDLNIYGNYKVEEFEKHDEGYGVVVTSRQLVFFDDCVEPIPITPELLKNNGWYFGLTSNEEDWRECIGIPSKLEDHWTCDEGDGEISLFFPNDFDGGLLRIDDQNYNRRIELVWCDTLYVHELQQALRLCGLNEIVDNFVI